MKKEKTLEPKWETLQHNGILFPPPFESQGIKIKINGQPVSLTIDQEEMVYQWAKKKDTPYVQDKVFQKNFTDDFAKTLNSKFKKLQYSDIDFSQAYKLVDKEMDKKAMMSKEEKKKIAAKRKELREKLKEEYGRAIIDGNQVEVGNYMAEPPGIFIGRGDHPMRGKWKPRVTAEDVILNLGKGVEEPKGNWKKIVNDQESMWLASWMDELTQKRKYVWLSDSAGIKQDRDKAKYDKAKDLAKSIDRQAVRGRPAARQVRPGPDCPDPGCRHRRDRSARRFGRRSRLSPAGDQRLGRISVGLPHRRHGRVRWASGSSFSAIRGNRIQEWWDYAMGEGRARCSERSG